jgi:hypothetical protein
MAVAVIVVVPAATPFTMAVPTPFDPTVAMAALPVVHVTSVDAPPNDVTMAVMFVVAAAATVIVVGLSVTDATPVTVTLVDALLLASPCAVAVIVAVPAPTAVMLAVFPLETRLTTFVFDDDHDTAVDAPLVTATDAVTVAVWFTVIDDGAPEIVTETTVGVPPVLPGLLQFGALTGHWLPPPPHAWSPTTAMSDATNARARRWLHDRIRPLRMSSRQPPDRRTAFCRTMLCRRVGVGLGSYLPPTDVVKVAYTNMLDACSRRN